MKLLTLVRHMHTKGIKEYIGAGDDATMVQFLDVVMKWRAEGGSFNVHTFHLQIFSCSGQALLEKSCLFCIMMCISSIIHFMYVNTTLRQAP